MLSEKIYEIYCWWPGEHFETLWLCKSLETAEKLLAWEQACVYNTYIDNIGLFGTLTWERYKRDFAPEFKIRETELFD